jgi:hypothetical protein
MARVNASEFAEKWKRRTAGATEDYRRGVQRVNVAPGQRAAEAQEKMMTNLIESITSGKWANNVASVSLQEWKDSAINKGLQRISAGVEGASPKMQRFATELLQAVDSAKAEIDSMPSTTFEDRLARMTAYSRRMHQFQYNK